MNAPAKFGIALLGAVLVAVTAFLLGAQSRQGEIDAAKHRTEVVTRDLDQKQRELVDTQNDLDSTQSELADANATLAACDADKASEVFDDLMSEYGSLLTQYSDYLDNSDLYFFVDWDALDREVKGHYNGRNSMQDQFDAALASCTTGSGTNA